MAPEPGFGVEFLPGAGSFADPPGVMVDPAQVVASLNANTDRAGMLERALADALVSRVSAGMTRASGLTNQLEGVAESRLAAATAKQQAMAGRLLKAANKALGQVYTYAFPYGYQYPTTEEAFARLQQGPAAYLQSVAGAPVDGVANADGNVPTSAGGITVGLEPTGQVRLPPSPISGVQPGPVPGMVLPTGQAIPIPPVVLPRGFPTAPGVVPVPPGSAPGFTPGPNGQPLPVVPSPVTGDQNPPGTIPSVGGTFGANGQPPTCPQGFSYSASAYLAGTVPCTDPKGCAPQPQTLRGLRTGQGQGTFCPQPVNGGWTGTYDVGSIQSDGQGGLRMPPWVESIPLPPSGVYSTVCVSGDCLFQPGTILTLHIPQGWVLAYDRQGGLLVAVNYLHGDLEEMATVPCVPNPTPPATVPPGCVPLVPAAQCPAPAPADCGPDKNLQLPPINLGVDVICAHIDQVLQDLVNNPTTFEQLLGMKAGQAPTGDSWKNWAYAILGVTNPVLPDLFGRLGKWLQGLQQKVANMVAGGDVQLLQVSVTRGLILLIHKYTGSVPAQLLRDIDYVSNTVRQSRLPSTAAADAGWLADIVTDDEWECYVKANGDYLDPARHIRDARRTRPNARAAQKLFLRNFIDQERFDKLVRADGVVNDTDKQDVLNEDNYWPATAEIFKWQQEQLYDEETIARFGLDSGFDDAYTDHLRTLTDGHQMDQDSARRHYMSIWRRPGYSELVEMTRRLRPDRVDASVVFTEEDLDIALKQEGYPQFYIDRLKAIRVHKPTRQDVRQLYDFHVIEEQELKDELQDMGYASDYADQQVQRWQIERQLQDYHRSGYPAAGTLANLYARGELSQNEFQNLAQRVVYYDGQLDDMTQAAVTAENIENKRLALAGVRHQFTSGLIDASGAHAALATVGLDGDQIDRLTQYWTHIKKSTSKQVGASELCRWRKDQLIGPIEQMQALIRLGYNGTDADLIVKDCTYQIAKAAEKALLSAEKQAAAAESKAAAAQAKAAKAKAKAKKSTPVSG